MNSFDYFELVFNNWVEYLESFLIVMIVYYYVYRRYFISILDPFTFASFFSAMAVTVPVFLFLINEISTRLFMSFLITQLSFFIGFRVFSPIDMNRYKLVKEKEVNDQEIRFLKWLFIIIGVSNILMQIFSYKLFGIPLFAEKSRLAIYGESGGVNNILKRVLDITSPFHIFLTIFFVYSKNKKLMFKLFTNLSVIIILIFSIFTGSKSAFMTFGIAFFVYSLYSIKWGDWSLFLVLKKFLLKFVVVVFLIAIVVIYITEDSDNPLVFLLFRLGQSGDVYYMSYPNAIIDKIPSVNWFVGLFASPLSLLGIIPRSTIPEPMGYFIMQYHYPTVEFKGPNARLNVFSYVYFGIIYSPIYCFIIGVIVSFFRNRLFNSLPRNVLGCIFYFLFLNAALKLEPDFHSALADFINIIVILPFFIFISYYLSLRNTDE